MSDTLSILEYLSDSNTQRVISADQLSELCAELKAHGGYQILGWKREADRGGQIELVITYEDRKA